ELLVQLSGTDFLAGLDDDLRLLLVEQSELTVGERGRLLDAGQRHDQVGIDRNWGAGNWEVLDSAQRVDTVVGFCGDFAIAEQIVLDAMLGSCHIAAPVMRRHGGGHGVRHLEFVRRQGALAILSRSSSARAATGYYQSKSAV